jgi:hypothetical protein
MKQAHLLTSTTAGVILGALVFGASPAISQMAVIDWSNLSIQQALKVIQDAMNTTLTTITGQLGATGPLATILGDATNGSVISLLVAGFTQNANYSKAAKWFVPLVKAPGTIIELSIPHRASSLA